MNSIFVGCFRALALINPCDERIEHRCRQGRRVRHVSGGRDNLPGSRGLLPDPRRGADPVPGPVARRFRNARPARELGAHYRALLAYELAERGYEITRATGKDGKYFELAGVPEELRAAFSGRSREVARAARSEEHTSELQ